MNTIPQYHSIHNSPTDFFQPGHFMNCRDDCAGLCFLRRLSEEVSDQWIRPTEENLLRKQRTSKGASIFMKCPGLYCVTDIPLTQCRG